MYAPLKLVSTYLGTHFNRLKSALRHANFMVVRQQWANLRLSLIFINRQLRGQTSRTEFSGEWGTLCCKQSVPRPDSASTSLWRRQLDSAQTQIKYCR